MTGIEVRGSAETVAALKNANTQIQNRTLRLVRDWGAETKAVMQEEAPYRTGRTRRSIITRYVADGFAFETLPDPVVYDADGVAYYARFLVFGTRFMPPNDFPTRAFRRVAPEFRSALADLLQRATNSSLYRSA